MVILIKLQQKRIHRRNKPEKHTSNQIRIQMLTKFEMRGKRSESLLDQTGFSSRSWGNTRPWGRSSEPLRLTEDGPSAIYRRGQCRRGSVPVVKLCDSGLAFRSGFRVRDTEDTLGSRVLRFCEYFPIAMWIMEMAIRQNRLIRYQHQYFYRSFE